jgi:uncharacterized protein
MRRPYYPGNLRALLAGRPTLGNLLDLCGENYDLLRKLAPDLPALRNRHRSRLGGQVDLFLEVREQTPYSSLLQLTYRFGGGGDEADPAAVLRAYHDARQLEVLALRQQVLPLEQGPDLATLERKWRANLFISKWLGYCWWQRHAFSAHSELCTSELLPCP